MPAAKVNGADVHFALTGRDADPVIVLSNSLGTNFSMWDPQVPELEKQFRVLRSDTRGEGLTSATPGPYTIEQLARDVLGLMDVLRIERAYFCGLSMGGMIGMWLGLNAPNRFDKLVLCNTAPKIGTPETWQARIDAIRRGGMAAVAESVCERWFTPAFRARSPEVVAPIRTMIESMPPKGYIANCEAVRDFDVREQIAQIRTPTLVISGTHDPATPPRDGQFIAERIAGARYVELDTSHLSNIAAPAEFTAALTDFLAA